MNETVIIGAVLALLNAVLIIIVQRGLKRSDDRNDYIMSEIHAIRLDFTKSMAIRQALSDHVAEYQSNNNERLTRHTEQITKLSIAVQVLAVKAGVDIHI